MEEHRKHPHITGFVIVSALLLIPFGIKLLAPALELYPSIILPSGPAVVRSSGESFAFKKLEILGYDLQSNELKALDPGAFLDPIPVQYFTTLAQTDFGLNVPAYTEVKIKKAPVMKFPNHQATPDEMAQAKSWLKAKLKMAGCRESSVVLRSVAMSANIHTKAATQVSVLDEKSIQLD